MYIITKYCFDDKKIDILHVEENYDDGYHICMDFILDDIKKYKTDGDQIIINKNDDIIVYRRGWHCKYELYHYLIHNYSDGEESAEDMKE